VRLVPPFYVGVEKHGVVASLSVVTDKICYKVVAFLLLVQKVLEVGASNQL